MILLRKQITSSGSLAREQKPKSVIGPTTPVLQSVYAIPKYFLASSPHLCGGLDRNNFVCGRGNMRGTAINPNDRFERVEIAGNRRYGGNNKTTPFHLPPPSAFLFLFYFYFISILFSFYFSSRNKMRKK